MVSKQFMQSLQKAEKTSTLCNCCKSKRSFETSCKEGMLHASTHLQLVLQHKPRRKLHRAQFYLLQRLLRFFETIARCSARLQRVKCLLQLAIDFFFSVAIQVAWKIASCNTSLKAVFATGISWQFFSLSDHFLSIEI